MTNRLEDDTLFLPMIPLRGLAAFPGSPLHFEAGRKKTMIALNQAMEGDRRVFLVMQKNEEEDNPDLSGLYEVGVVATVNQLLRGGKDVVHVVTEGLYRARIQNIIQDSPFFAVEVRKCEEKRSQKTLKNSALIRTALDSLEEYVEASPMAMGEALDKLESVEDVGRAADSIAALIRLEPEKAQLLLEEMNSAARMEKLLVFMESEIALLELENKIQAKVKEQIDKNQKDYYLREQLRAISLELGDGDSPQEEAQAYQERIKALHLSNEVEDKLLQECAHLTKMPFGSHEATVIRNYLDTCLSLPWNTVTHERIHLNTAKKILDRDHYGLEKVKERMIEMLAVRKLAPNISGQIICLVGPPGVGKTSIARSIAAATNRKYVRVSLGGVRDEADIRGHRKTYIGAMPGRMIEALRTAGTKNPLILLDEVDKLSSDFRGDPSSALLELLDGEQNVAFHDHYIDLPFDMSQVLFITTANDPNSIPAPLLDRMEVIQLSSYTHEEKFHIAKKYLLPKQVKRHGLDKKQIKVSDDALHVLIDGYTREAGVRTLERTISSLCRKSAKLIVSGEMTVVKITKEKLETFLGSPKVKSDKLAGKDEVGVANGLAWTAVGGEILPVEVAVMEGTGKLEMTGSLGDVMKESAKTAISCVRSHAREWKIDPDFYKKYDIHIHVPEGAVPKDGPSAGITLTTAIVSALTGTPVRGDVAMTGEVTLRGRVLPIGGLREKTMAAYCNHMKKVLIPKENESDLDEVEDIVRKSVEFLSFENVADVLAAALRYPPKQTQTSKEEPAVKKDYNEIPLPANYIAQQGEQV